MIPVPVSPPSFSCIVWNSRTVHPFLSICSSAVRRASFSAAPPPTVPSIVPSGRTIICVPEVRGTDPAVDRTVTRIKAFPVCRCSAAE